MSRDDACTILPLPVTVLHTIKHDPHIRRRKLLKNLQAWQEVRLVDSNAQGSPLIVPEDHSIFLRPPAIVDTSLKALQLTR